jgi:hypothetical protein
MRLSPVTVKFAVELPDNTPSLYSLEANLQTCLSQLTALVLLNQPHHAPAVLTKSTGRYSRQVMIAITELVTIMNCHTLFV